METRAMAIALFFAVGTAIGGITGPLLFGELIETEKETPAFWGYVLGAALMLAAAVIQAIWGVKTERRSLEDLATPVLAEEAGHAPDDDEPPPRASPGATDRRAPRPAFSEERPRGRAG